jgi:hypothetical protein
MGLASKERENEIQEKCAQERRRQRGFNIGPPGQRAPKNTGAKTERMRGHDIPVRL